MEMVLEEQGEIPPIDSRGEPLGTGRSAGIHVSQVLKRLRKAWGMKVDGIEGEQPWLRAFFGFVLERALETAFKWFYQRVRPVVSGIELSMDDVFLTPDGFNTEDLLVEEYKLSWTNLAQFEADPLDRKKSHPDWILQIMSYCRAYRVLEARLIVFWVNGDYTYKPGHGPQIKSYRLRFTEQEIEDGWRLILGEVEDMRREEAA